MRFIFDTVLNGQIYFRRKWALSLAVILIISNYTIAHTGIRQRISINEGWRFMRYTSQPDNLIYDERPQVTDRNDNVVADTKPTEAMTVGTKHWAEQIVKTTGDASQLLISADRNRVSADGEDLSFITVKVADKNRLLVPDANNKISFSIQGPGEIIATDNGDPASLVSLASTEREAYFGLLLAIVRPEKKQTRNNKDYGIITRNKSGHYRNKK